MPGLSHAFLCQATIPCCCEQSVKFSVGYVVDRTVDKCNSIVGGTCMPLNEEDRSEPLKYHPYRPFQQNCGLLAAEQQALSNLTATYVKCALLPHSITWELLP
eukprot:6212248-Pleurochrysis_carterae.AAC.6